jgi:reactive intermediate/imine deaminase
MTTLRMTVVTVFAAVLAAGCAHHRMHAGEGCPRGEHREGCQKHEGCQHEEGKHEGCQKPGCKHEACKHAEGEPCAHEAEGKPCPRHGAAVTAATSAEPVFLNSEEAAARNLPFSEAVRAGGLLYLAGQLGTAPGKLELVPGGIEAEAAQALANVKAVLEHNGSSLRKVVKCTVFLADMKDWPAFNAVYRTAFTPPFPARSALAASGLALGAKVEVECIAVP